MKINKTDANKHSESNQLIQKVIVQVQIAQRCIKAETRSLKLVFKKIEINTIMSY